MAKRILVVDDDELIRLALESLLSAKGYAVVCAEGGGQALKKLESEDFSAVILDIVMPRMDGFEVCRQIRNRGKTAHIPVILLTAKSMEEDQTKGVSAGADLFLSKPISPEKLLAVLEKIHHP